MPFQRSKPTKNGGHIPPPDLPTGAIFHFVTIRKPLWLSRSSLIYEPTTIPFVIRVPCLSTLFILPSLYLPSSLPLYFSISSKLRIVGSGTVRHRETSTSKRECTSTPFCTPSIECSARYRFDRVTTIPASSYKSRGLAPRTSVPARVNFWPRFLPLLPPIVSINEIYVARSA